MGSNEPCVCREACKQPYDTKKAAKRALKHIQTHSGSTVRRIYRCRRCGLYYLTSQPRR